MTVLIIQCWEKDEPVKILPASLGDAAQRALVKLHSLGIAVDDSIVLDTVPAFFYTGLDLPIITRAIAERQILEFTYRNFDLSEDERRIIPIGLSTRSGLWYFSGVDQSIEEIRSFRIDRVIGNFVVKRGPKGFETPENFDSQRIFETTQSVNALINVRCGKGASLRALASATKPLGEWDQIQIPILDIKNLSALVLWHGDDVYVQSPPELREIVVESLKGLVQAHGS